MKACVKVVRSLTSATKIKAYAGKKYFTLMVLRIGITPTPNVLMQGNPPVNIICHNDFPEYVCKEKQKNGCKLKFYCSTSDGFPYFAKIVSPGDTVIIRNRWAKT